jgi:lipopolysaccharide heptosyltransferase II
LFENPLHCWCGTIFNGWYQKSQSLSKITNPGGTLSIVPPEILIIRLSALGDVVTTLPLAAAIKRHLPGSQVTWLVEKMSAPLLFNNPAIDRVIVFPGKTLLPALMATPPVVNSIFKRCLGREATAADPPGITQMPLGRCNARQDARLSDGSSPPEARLNSLRQFWREFKSQNYDIAIDAQGLLKSALLCWLSGAKTRIGYANTREYADKFLTHPVDIGDVFAHDRHVIDSYHKLALKLFELTDDKANPKSSNIPFPEFSLPAVPGHARHKVQNWLNNLTSSPSEQTSLPVAVLIPGTTWPTKIWPTAKWQELSHLLIERDGYKVILCGGASEMSINKQIEGPGILNLTGKTSLLELIVLFEQAQLVIGGDTGPLHLANAVGKAKVVGIFGSTPWKRNGPYGANALSIALNLDCQPCFSKTCRLNTTACLNDLSAEYVYQEITKFIPKPNGQ